jgi:CHAP domain
MAPTRKPSSREPGGIRELQREVREFQRANDGRGSRPPHRAGEPPRGTRRGRQSPVRSRRRRLGLVLGVAIVVAIALHVLSGNSASFPLPSQASLAGLSLRQRIVTIADSQVGYSTNPSQSYCNKFSAYWSAGATTCPGGELSEEWCADFAAWAWQKAGVQFIYGYDPGEVNGGAASFYQWAVAHGEWHPADSGYVAAPGDVAVYGLSLVPGPSAAHVAIVTGDPRGQRGPDVINGDGDRTGFSVVETGTDQVRADAGHHRHAPLAGYVSPP